MAEVKAQMLSLATLSLRFHVACPSYLLLTNQLIIFMTEQLVDGL